MGKPDQRRSQSTTVAAAPPASKVKKPDAPTNMGTAVAAGAAGALAASLGLGAIFGGRPITLSDLAAATLGAGAATGALILTKNPHLARQALRISGRSVGRVANQPARKLNLPTFSAMAGAGAAGGFVGVSLNGSTTTTPSAVQQLPVVDTGSQSVTSLEKQSPWFVPDKE